MTIPELPALRDIQKLFSDWFLDQHPKNMVDPADFAWAAWKAAIAADRAARAEPAADEREAFEAFAQNCPMGKYSIERDTRPGQEGGYWSSHTQLMWDTWQARAADRADPAAPAADEREARQTRAPRVLAKARRVSEHSNAWNAMIGNTRVRQWMQGTYGDGPYRTAQESAEAFAAAINAELDGGVAAFGCIGESDYKKRPCMTWCGSARCVHVIGD